MNTSQSETIPVNGLHLVATLTKLYLLGRYDPVRRLPSSRIRILLSKIQKYILEFGKIVLNRTVHFSTKAYY